MKDTTKANLRQSLIEAIADWLDSQYIQLEQNINGLYDPEGRDGDIHIRMAEAAFRVYCEQMKINDPAQ